MVDYYTEVETDTLLYTNCPSLSFIDGIFYSKAEIDSTLSDYITSTQIDDSCCSKNEIDTTLNLYPSAQKNV